MELLVSSRNGGAIFTTYEIVIPKSKNLTGIIRLIRLLKCDSNSTFKIPFMVDWLGDSVGKMEAII